MLGAIPTQDKAKKTEAPKPIAALGWLVGGVWTADATKLAPGMLRIETRYQWSDNNAFIRFNTHFVSETGTMKNYDGQFFWIPEQSSLGMWYMNPGNSITQGPVRLDGDVMEMSFRAEDFEGKQADMRVKVTRKTNDDYNWLLEENTAGGWKQLMTLEYLRLAGSAQEVHNTSYSTKAGERVLRIETIVPMPLEQVWNAWTTQDGLKEWIAPVVAIDFRIGGTISTNYDRKTKIGDSGTITLPITNYIERQLITLKVNLNDSFARKARDEDQNLQEIVQIADIGDGKTKLVSSMVGWGAGKEWDDAYAFFARGNEWTYQQLAKYLSRAGSAHEQSVDPDALKIRARRAECSPTETALSPL